MYSRDDIRNIAIIAHVDHGKTTLVDQMLLQSGIFRENQKVAERVMDSNDLERERGITILSKNTAVQYEDYKINIVDTPGHADFGGEVERVLKMVDGVLLLVDSFEGPMPQTRFVLKKAIELKLSVVVVINKMDRHDARPEEVADEVLDLLIELEADDDQLEVPFVYASARDGLASESPEDKGTSLEPLFKAILENIPAPSGYKDKPLQILVSTVDYNEYVGRIAVGRVVRGGIKSGQEALLCREDKENKKVRISNLYQFMGLGRTPVEDASVGDIVAVSGVEGINIGDTICDVECPEPLPFVDITQPTVSITFSVNNSPFAGREGKFVTSRNLRDRLYKEAYSDVSLKVEDTQSPDSLEVSGRGELHLSILIENMRREGYEFQVSNPVVIIKEVDGKKQEPYERAIITVPEEFMGTVIEKMGMRKGELSDMKNNQGTAKLEFVIPSRGLFGYRTEFLTDTKGEGIFNSVFDSYKDFKGDMPIRQQGSLVAFQDGQTTTYGLFNGQQRGILFLEPGIDVYEGMVVGRSSRQGDVEVNVCRKKQLTNMRASGSDDSMKLVTPSRLSLEEALEYIDETELVEVTPANIRIRKKILNTEKRKKSVSRKKS